MQEETPTADARPRVCYLLTAPVATSFLRGQLRYLRGAGYDVTVVTSPGPELAELCEREGVDWVATPIAREISLLADLVTLARLVWLFLRLRPTIVNAGTPKAGLLGMVAAALTLVPVRVYVLRGLRLETIAGFKRRVLWLAEKAACWLSHRVVCVSESLRRSAVELNLTSLEKSCVLANGSSNGVHAARFAPPGRLAASSVRRRWGVPMNGFVYGAVGRITQDKGATCLVEAFTRLAEEHPDVWLLMAGKHEQGDAVSEACRRQIERHPRIVTTGFLTSPQEAYAAMDVLVMPSLREGFPNVVGEAAAAGRPTIGRRVTGTVDAIVDQETGLLVPAEGSEPLHDAMVFYHADRETARHHGRAGRRRIQRDFAPERVWSELLALYTALLAEKGLAAPRPAPALDEQQRRAA